MLYLEQDKKYIGKTTDIRRRMNEHFNGFGSKVTQKFKPIRTEIVMFCHGYFSDDLEQLYTKHAIKIYGYANVRGGNYVNSNTFICQKP